MEIRIRSRDQFLYFFYELVNLNGLCDEFLCPGVERIPFAAGIVQGGNYGNGNVLQIWK